MLSLAAPYLAALGWVAYHYVAGQLSRTDPPYCDMEAYEKCCEHQATLFSFWSDDLILFGTWCSTGSVRR